MLLKNALIIVSACLLFSLNINTAEAGFLDDLKKKAEEASQQTKDKTKDLVSKEKKSIHKKRSET